MTKVPSISTSGTTVYLYYGNPSATNVESGNNVFLWFDNFEDSSISDWTIGDGAWGLKSQNGNIIGRRRPFNNRTRGLFHCL